MFKNFENGGKLHLLERKPRFHDVQQTILRLFVPIGFIYKPTLLTVKRIQSLSLQFDSF